MYCIHINLWQKKKIKRKEAEIIDVNGETFLRYFQLQTAHAA